jgi:hypothetical protein
MLRFPSLPSAAYIYIEQNTEWRLWHIRHRHLLLVLLLCMLPTVAWAEVVYVGQSSAGGDTGTDCANQHSASWFNTAVNWRVGAGKISPGDTVHLCGTITTGLIVQGSGSAGNVITILWETNAKISLPFCNDIAGCFDLEVNDFITLDGGVNGIIEANANGTGLANQQSGNALTADQGNQNIEIKNLTIQNCYVRAKNDAPKGLDHARAVYVRGNFSNFSFHHNTVHDCDGGLAVVIEANSSNATVHNNNIYNVNAGMVFAGSNRSTHTGLTIYNNHIHDTSNWDEATNSYHHNGLFIFGPPQACCTNTTIIQDLKIYNNLFDGDIGDHATSHGVYLAEIEVPNALIFNNVTSLANNPISANGLYVIAPYNGSNVSVLNNTLICASAGAQPGALGFGSNNGPSSAYIIKNNVVVNCAAFAILGTEVSTYPEVNYNVYVRSDAASWKFGGTFYNTLAEWQASSGQDVHAKYTSSSAGLDSTFHPQSDSIVVGAGTNLTRLRITPLNYDKAGVPRSSTGPWDVGAYSYTGSGPAPLAPTRLQVK